MKRILSIMLIIILLATVVGCSNTDNTTKPNEQAKSLEGKFVGYSWKDEAKGVEFKDAEEYIETILELDKDGIIKDVKMGFFVKKDGYWIMRQSGNASVKVNFNVDPAAATPGENYKKGSTMFSIHTADMMSFYSAAVNEQGVVAVAMVDPVTRYMFEMKLPTDFDYNKPVGELTVGSGLMIPTVRTSGGGIEKPTEWNSYKDKTIFGISQWSHVVNDKGVLEGITEESSTKSFLEALGVEFDGGKPKAMDAKYGYFGNGGWNGNYRAIEEYLIGKNAKELTSLIDWSNPRYSNSINDKNFFGVDTVAGATKTVQNSTDGIAGATVRMSREATSYQRALVAAGLIKEEDVIKGRF